MNIRLQEGSAFFAAELLLAELIFLHGEPRRKYFAVRFFTAGAIAIISASLRPWISADPIVTPYLFRSLIIFGITVAVMAVSFDIPFQPVLYMSGAGYALQHIAHQLTVIARWTPFLRGVSILGLDRGRVVEIIVVAALYLLFYLVFGRKLSERELHKNIDSRIGSASLIIVVICTVMTRIPRIVGEVPETITGSLYAIMCCLLALFIQFAFHRIVHFENESVLMKRIRQEERKQYEISKNTIDSINIKIHDTRHKIVGSDRRLPEEEVESLMQDIDVYDSMIRTGNDALDVLLNEKSYACQRKEIRLTCSGSGSVLSFMSVMDTYSLFGNAIENAMEAVEKLEKEKRFINISIEERGDLVFLSFMNYFKGDMSIDEGIPVTTKTDEEGYHGFGVKSMRRIAAKYDGELILNTKGEIFYLTIYLRNTGEKKTSQTIGSESLHS